MLAYKLANNLTESNELVDDKSSQLQSENDIISHLIRQNNQLQQIVAEYNALIRTCIETISLLRKYKTNKVEDTQ